MSGSDQSDFAREALPSQGAPGSSARTLDFGRDGQAPTDASLMELSHVTLEYESGSQALNDVSLSVAPGEWLCVLGANGSGKSTLASVLCGLLAPDAGSVRLVGEDVFDGARDARIDFDAYRRARRSIGLVFQNPDDQIVTTVVDEDVAFGPENLGVPPAEIGRRVERELRRVAMQDFAKADPTHLSGGQKQRVAIAGALAMEPQVLVLDEPGSLLDVRGRTAILRVMGRLREAGTTIVHITHFMDEALEADRVVVLNAGRVALEGTPREVFDPSHAELLTSLGLEEPFEMRLRRRVQFLRCEDCLSTAPSGPRTGQLAILRGRARTEDSPAQQEQPAISVEHVSFAYRRERKALDDVSLEIAQGESLAIIGQTGSGKSTLLRLLCALEVPDEGRVVINGICTARKRSRRRLHGTIGYVMQHPERQLFASTVLEDVSFGPRNMGLSASEISQRCAKALHIVGLVGFDDASPFELSGGQQRLCALAGILAMQPKTLVLDEPRAGLDPRGRHELRGILNNIHALGTTIVQVTHSMEEAARAERIVVLDQARVLLMGTPAEVFCAKNEELLLRAGLGLPLPLAWALAHGIESSPLTLDALAQTISTEHPSFSDWGDSHGA